MAKYLDVKQDKISHDGKDIVLKKDTENFIKIPLRKDGSIPIKYLAIPNDFKHIPYWEVLKKNFPKENFKDKIVFQWARLFILQQGFFRIIQET